ncbi:MAG: c-type cytochrome domain-containing protein [Puniceicoccaceae bacterium]
MDQWILFLGRFHPLVIHLPIGLLVGLCCLELLRPCSKHPDEPSRLLLLLLVLLGSIGSIATGLMLEQEGGYSASRIFWHKWLGIAMTGVVCFSLYACLKLKQKERFPEFYRASLALATLLMAVGAHHGGVMTHGRHFLTEHLPFGKAEEPAQAAEKPAVEADDGQVSFTAQVWPILEARCVECHGEDKMKAELRLDSPEAIMKGSEWGAVVTAGDPDDSSLYFLTTYPEDDEDRMPPEGEPLTAEQIEILRLWIEQGAVF